MVVNTRNAFLRLYLFGSLFSINVIANGYLMLPIFIEQKVKLVY
jgi:hypothetical protein